MVKITTYDRYLEVKNQYKDGIVLFQSGDFLRAYYYDALVLNDILGYKRIVLSLGGLRYCLGCGFNQKYEINIVKQLVDNGYKVIVCKNVTNPETSHVSKEVTGEYDKPGYQDISKEWQEHFDEFDGKSEDELCAHFDVVKIKRPKRKNNEKLSPSTPVSAEKCSGAVKLESIDMNLYSVQDNMPSEEARKNELWLEFTRLRKESISMEAGFYILQEWKRKYHI